MEGLMLCCARPLPLPQQLLSLPAPLATRRRERSPIVLAAADSRRSRHSSSCWCGSAAVPSIWHAITPSPLGLEQTLTRTRTRTLPTRRGRSCPISEEGSWNAAWDARPARWLHGSHSAWMLFGVCSCFPLLGERDAVNVNELEALAPAMLELEAELDAATEENSNSISNSNSNAADTADADVIAKVDADAAEQYRVTGMSADGRCLFRAIAYGACLNSGKEAPDEKQQQQLADELRARVADELLKRRNEIERFIEEDFDKYLERMRQPYIWGGEPELLMASHVLQTPLSVFMKEESSRQLTKIANYGEDYGKCNKSVNVLFHGYGHYDALLIA